MSPTRLLLVACCTFLLGSLPVFAAADQNWSSYLGDPGRTHYSDLDQINTENVAGLQVAWTFHAGGASANNRSQIQCNPLIVDGVLYGTTPRIELVALNATNGTELWRFDPSATRSGGNRGGPNRGLIFWRGDEEQRILFAAGSLLYALNPETGQPVESFGNHGHIDLLAGLGRDVAGLFFSATTPGAIYRDLLIMGGRVGEGPAPAAPGHIRAFDVRTGEQRWIFHTIPHPGEFGHDTWPDGAWQHAGGVNSWAGLTVDADRGLVFVPTGSASFDFWGGDRAGDNLFANCLLALDAATGERVWHFQFVHHDVWDRDLPAPPVLCEVERDGRTIAAVAQTTKSGHVWVFDRETGQSLFPWEEVTVLASPVRGEVLSPTQPLPLLPAPFARQQFGEDLVTNRTPEAHTAVLERLRAVRPHVPFDPPSERGTIVFPGYDGGAEWGGAAVDPDGVMYVNSSEMAWILELVPVETEMESSPGEALYRQLCMACHGENFEGNAAQNIASLLGVGERLSEDDIIHLLRTGKGTMPSFDFIPAEHKQGLAEYLRGESKLAEASPSDTANAWRPPLFATTGYNRFFDPDGYPAVKPPWGTLNAIDLNTGEYRWTIPLGEYPELTAEGIPLTGTENYGGPVVTAGNLVFIAATKDEKFRAFDRRTGEELWEADLPAAGYATPATYSVNGRQYIVVACGGGKIGTKSADTYVAFALP